MSVVLLRNFELLLFSSLFLFTLFMAPVACDFVTDSKEILLYHVIEGNKLTTDFRERNYETLNGQTIRWDEQGNGCPDGVESRDRRSRRSDRRSGSSSDSDSDSKDEDESGGCTDGFEVDGYRVIDAFGDANEVVTVNVQAVNGVVHTIDGVLLPRDWQPSS